jgi:hypothetical protein
MSIISSWAPLKGKLDKESVRRATAVAVRHNNGSTEIKEISKDMLWQYNLSSLYTHYRIL